MEAQIKEPVVDWLAAAEKTRNDSPDFVKKLGLLRP